MTANDSEAAAIQAAVGLSVAEVATEAAEVFSSIRSHALLLALPEERIVASSEAAARLLDPTGHDVVGHVLEEYTSGPPSGALALFERGSIEGYEAPRRLNRGEGQDDLAVRMWYGAYGHQPSARFVLVKIIAGSATRDRPEVGLADQPIVVGTTNESLSIERIGSESEALFGLAGAELIGKSLTSLVDAADVTTCLAALSEASSTHHAVTLRLSLSTFDPARSVRCDLLILPLQPSPSCGFAFMPLASEEGEGLARSDLRAALIRLSRAAHVAHLARGVTAGLTERDLPGLSLLTARELEIATSLLAGDRVPAIATELFLSQSTVRSHLASIYAKLGLRSQQQLVNVVRASRSRLGYSGRYPSWEADPSA